MNTAAVRGRMSRCCSAEDPMARPADTDDLRGAACPPGRLGELLVDNDVRLALRAPSPPLPPADSVQSRIQVPAAAGEGGGRDGRDRG